GLWVHACLRHLLHRGPAGSRRWLLDAHRGPLRPTLRVLSGACHRIQTSAATDSKARHPVSSYAPGGYVLLGSWSTTLCVSTKKFGDTASPCVIAQCNLDDDDSLWTPRSR